jgi:hypothetical protein
MTGGLGFSKLGKDLFDNNHKQLNRRTKMGENPYAGGKTKRNKKLNPYLREIQHWKNSKIRNEKKMKFIYLGSALALMILLYIIL